MTMPSADKLADNPIGKITTLSNIAVHDAGHAVIARVLGIDIYGVSIVESDDLLGNVDVPPLWHWERGDGPKRPIAEARCMMCFAGREAERVIFGQVDDQLLDGADRDDAWEAMTWGGLARGAVFVGDDAYGRAEARYRRRANDLVRTHLVAIVRVAMALMERSTLTASEIDALR